MSSGRFTAKAQRHKRVLGRLRLFVGVVLLAQVSLPAEPTVRIGVVQGRGGGALQKMLLPFRLGVGGPVGNGRQWISWIHLEDLLRMFEWLLDNDQAHGIYNGTAPEPVSNRDLSKALGRVLRRPAIFPVPGFVLRVALGEVSVLLTEGQHVTPGRALADGFSFRFPEIEPALRDLLA